MKFTWPLIRWQMGNARFWNVLVAAVTTLYLLVRARPLTFDSPWWFPPLHAAVIAWFLGRTTTSASGYLYLQGYSRDRLWWHNVLSAFGCALCAWLPAAIVVLLPVRSWWQDSLANPFFPYMAPAEARFIWLMLWLYAVCVPLALYLAARWAHPARSNDAGLVLSSTLSILLLMAFENARLLSAGQTVVERWPLLLGGLLAAAVALVLGKRLHRELEVQA